MRIKNSIKNIYISILTQIVITLLGFISRKVFIDNLGTEYLGINGLLTNILSMLSLVEGGIGTSIVYNLYKPLADKDEYRVIALVQLYKKLYGIIAIVIFIISLSLYPFLNIFIKDGISIKYLGVVYFIFVIKNIISYLNAHKWSLINADQKAYVLAKYNLVFNIITIISKIVILKVTQDYILYLLVEILIFVFQNLWNGKIVNERYPYIRTRKKYKVEKDIKENLITNVKALFLHNIGSYCVFGTDNILISTFINIKAVGLYSNYTMIIGQLSALLNPILNGVSASVGNLIATESDEKIYNTFNVIYLINFWIYSLSSILLFNLLEPFIEWCFGKNLLLNKITFIFILLNFYITGMRNSIGTFKAKSGIFSQDKYIPLLESIVNLGASIILVRIFGLAGIFMGTTISTICLPFWIQAKLVYRNVFNKSVIEYFKKYFFYIILTLIAGGVTTLATSCIKQFTGFEELVIKGLICCVIPNFVFILVFYKTEEFRYLIDVIKNLLNEMNITNKIKSSIKKILSTKGTTGKEL